jgi:hypothetical protein
VWALGVIKSDPFGNDTLGLEAVAQFMQIGLLPVGLTPA